MPKGACCACCAGEELICIDDTTQTNCEDVIGGEWQGILSVCDTNGDGVEDLCNIATGACCMPNGGCSNDTSMADCEAVGGAYQGDDSICSNSDCLGACCFGTVCAADTTGSECDGLGGTWYGPITSCEIDPTVCQVPDPVGACCPAAGGDCREGT